MSFQRAPPEVNGFGVMTSTPGFVRSSQVLIFLGLPGRTASTTTDLVTKPLKRSPFQPGATSPAVTSLVTSGSSDRATTSAGRPDSTARSCSPDAPYDWSK